MRKLTMPLILFLAIVAPTALYAQNYHGMQMSTTAQKDHIYISYEEARQAVIRQSLPDVKRAATHVSVAAQSEDQHDIAVLGAELEKAPNIDAARSAFAKVSDAVIRYRDTHSASNRPMVVYCPMQKKSWLQPRGDISNPYLDETMRSCGQIKEK